jgi:ABC-type transport system involved in multi-copper enzyme maturation permease subunit
MASVPDDADGIRHSRRPGATILVIVLLLAMLGIGIVLGRTIEPIHPWRVAWWAFGSLVFGALVGLSEILSRYRDEPVLASTTSFGLWYLTLNGLISLAAFAVLRVYADKVFPAVKDDLFLTAVVAGFGGMTVFRSKLFTFRSTDGKEYAIGPAIVLETALKTLDHKIDRRRATERQARVFREMSQMRDFDRTAQYIEASLNSFQNLSLEEKAEIRGVIQEYRKLEWPNELKIMALGFAFLNIAGEENFDTVVANMRKLIAMLTATPAPVPPPAGQPPPTV